jgi:hypothetical protein
VIDESLLADKIKAQGGKTVEEYEREQAEKKKPKPFAGVGNSIRGGTVEVAPSPALPTENHHTIHLWRNGIRCSCSSRAHPLQTCVTPFQLRRRPPFPPLRPASTSGSY